MDSVEAILQELDQLPEVQGITPIDLLGLPLPLPGIMRQVLRQGGISLNDLAAGLQTSPDLARKVGQVLVRKGFLRDEKGADGSSLYRANTGNVRGRLSGSPI